MSKYYANASIEINAPIETVWAVMLDLPRYGEWNPFVVDIAGIDGAAPISQIGARLLLDVRMVNNKTLRCWETITHMDAPAHDDTGQQTALLVYRYTSWPAQLGLVQAGRRQSLTQQKDRPTIYFTEENFHGILSPFLPLTGVRDGFQRHAQALKQRAEALVAN
ncbi:MAG TPA: SRPBCC domain-containing protein [Rhodocyclaceae bacterium]|nr:SRPBCC domain-containing protein [Rhodocyclaceae bacterium]